LGFWVWGVGPQPPTPNPQSPIPNPQFKIFNFKNNNLCVKLIIFIKINKFFSKLFFK